MNLSLWCNLKGLKAAYRIMTVLKFSYILFCNLEQITLQRTELNSPLGLEVNLHITEAVCPALSEPGF